MRPHDDARWLSALAHYRQFVAQHGHGQVPVRHVADDGFGLGKWVANQKTLRREGTLRMDRAQLLHAEASRSWSALDDSWQESLDRFVRFVELHGRLPHLEEEWEGRRIGAWMRNQRRANREGRIQAQRRAALETTPLWRW